MVRLSAIGEASAAGKRSLAALMRSAMLVFMSCLRRFVRSKGGCSPALALEAHDLALPPCTLSGL